MQIEKLTLTECDWQRQRERRQNMQTELTLKEYDWQRQREKTEGRQREKTEERQREREDTEKTERVRHFLFPEKTQQRGEVGSVSPAVYWASNQLFPACLTCSFLCISPVVYCLMFPVCLCCFLYVSPVSCMSHWLFLYVSPYVSPVSCMSHCCFLCVWPFSCVSHVTSCRFHMLPLLHLTCCFLCLT